MPISNLQSFTGPGGALHPGLVEKLKSETSLEVHVATDPLNSVIRDAAKAFLV